MAYANYNTTCNTIDKVLRAILPKGNTILSCFHESKTAEIIFLNSCLPNF